MAKLEELIRLNEKEKLFPYKDTVGKLTIGIGHNLTDKGISRAVSAMIFQEDLDEAKSTLFKAFPWVTKLDEVRYAALVDMTFNMGINSLKKFVTSMPFIRDGNYKQAAITLRKSLWYRQTESRGVKITKMIETGEWPDGQS